MKTRLRFFRSCVMALGMVLAMACGHGSPELGAAEHVGSLAQAVELAWPLRPVVSAGKVGTLPGGGGVGPAGDYHYSLPIEVPPGRAGMTPSLSLSYSSTAGNGAVGVGWTLNGGMSVIAPCNKTFATDGVAENDTATCLDGARLVEVGPNDFRTLSSGFARISRDHPPGCDDRGGYKVELQDGRIRWYLTPVGPLFHADSMVLTSEQDADGNEIRYVYDNVRYVHSNAGSGGHSVPWSEVYLSEIDYGKAAAPSCPQPLSSQGGDFSRKILFRYSEQRPDPLYSDVEPVDYAGSLGHYWDHVPHALQTLTRPTAITRRLDSIACFAPGAATESQPPQLAWTYQLAYAQSTGSGRSLLRSITRVGALGGTSYAKEFSWEQTKGGTYTDATGTALPSFGDPDQEVTALDVDNDGKDELLVAMPAGGIPTPQLYSTDLGGPLLGRVKWLTGLTPAMLTDSRTVDLDGDGVPEIVAPDRGLDAQGTAAYGLYHWSNALEDYERITPPEPLWASYRSALSSNAEQPLFFADFDGDGLPDLVQARHQRLLDPTCEDSPAAGRPRCLAYDWYYAHNTGGGTFSPKYVVGDHDLPIFTSDLAQEIYYAPFSGSPFAALSTSDEAGRAHLFAAAVYSPSFSGPLMLAELPGEGSPSDWNGSLPSASLCGLGDFQGRGSYQKECFDPLSAEPFLPAPYWRVATFDVDADGRADLIAYNFTTDDSGHFQVTGGSYRISYDVAGVRHQDPLLQVPLVGGDFNGDGIQDAYLYDRITDTSYVGLQTKPTRDLMNAVGDETRGSKPTEKVSYSQRWSPDPVTPLACHHPQRCLRRGMNVVVEHDVYQGADVDAYEHHLYSYDDPRTDVQGAGFLGFATVREWNPDRPSETITTYDNAPTTHPNVYGSFLPTVERTYVPVDPLDSASKRTGAASLTVRVSETRSHFQGVYPYLHGGSVFAAEPHFFYRDAWTSTEWESRANLDWSPGTRIANHFTGASPPEPALRVRTGFRWVNDYGNDVDVIERTAGGATVEVKTLYEPHPPKSFYFDRVQTRWTTVKGPNSTTPPAPRRVDYAYDPLGHLASVSVEATRNDDPDVQSKVELDYTNGHGLVTTITKTAPGEAPRHTYLEYDPEESIFPKKTWNDLGHTSWSLYHPMYGVLSEAIDLGGVVTEVRLDDFGRVVQTARAGQPGTEVNTRYQARTNSQGELIGTTIETTGLGIVRTRVTLDGLGRVVLDEHTGFEGLPIVRQTDYDTLGRVVASRRPITLYPGQTYLPTQDITSYTYDALNRLRRVVAPDKSTVTQTPTFWQTDAVGPAPASPVPGFVVPHSYVVRDVDGHVVTSAQVAKAGTLATTFVYGDFDELRKVLDPTTQNVTRLGYDQLGRRTVLEDPDTGTSTSHYNGFGELTRVDAPSVDGSAVPAFTTYWHDALGRITATENADGVTKFAWDTSPNGIGQLASRSSPEGTIETFTYNALGQLAQQAWKVPRESLPAESFAMAMEYDASGRLATLAYPEVPGRPTRFKVQQSYVHGYLKQIGPYAPPGQPTSEPLWSVSARNADDRLLVGTTGNGVTEKRTYEPATGRLATILAGSNASLVPALSLAYAYWPDGAVKSRVDSPRQRSETFDYNDGLSRLTGWQLTNGGTTRDVGYHYDPLGNLDQITTNHVVTETNTPDPKRPHALATSVQSGVERSFTYDARGRQVATPERRVVFTEHNLPKTITTPAGTTSFLYDAGGERVRKSEPKTGGETLSLGRVYERRTAGISVQHIFYVQGTDGHLAQITYDETTKVESRAYVHPDALGTASAVTDDNKVVTRFDNEPFGKRVQPSGAAFTGDFPNVQVGFTGHSTDDDLGLVNMKGRIYDPSQRRFLSPDPLVSRPLNAQSYNRYSYVYNNPLSFTDPSGFEGEGLGENYCAKHPNDPPCAPAPPGGAGPGSGGNWVENPSAGTCGPGTNHPCPTSAPAEARQSVASKFHVVSVPVFDAVVNSDAVTPGRVPVYIDRGSDQTVDVPPPPRFQMARQALMLARVLDPQTDAAIRFAEGIHATVVEPVIDWVDDMHTASPGRMRDHSEAMAGAMGTVVLAAIMPEEAALSRALTAADLGLTSSVLTTVDGSVFLADGVKIITVNMIEGPIGQIGKREALNALPNVLRAARAEGVQILQIDAAFGNPSLASFVFKQAEKLGGTTAASGGRDTITFALGWVK